MIDTLLFVGAKIAAVGTQPLFWVGVLLTLAWWQCGTSPKRGRRLLGLGLVLFVSIGWQIVPFKGIQALETQYPKASGPLERYAGAIVLGGAFEHYNFFAQTEASTSDNMQVSTPATLMRGHGHWRLVFTGGHGALNATGPSESDWAREFFEQQGLDMQRVQIESQSRTTRENAVNTAALLGAECRSKPWLLITSANHMPRTLEAFLSLGCQVYPYPVNFQAVESEQPHWTHYDMLDSAALWRLVLHEWLGVWFYRFIRVIGAAP